MVVMGRIAGAFGIKGWVKVQTFTQSIDGLLAYPTWWLKEGSAWRENKVEEAAVHGRSVIAKLSGVDDRDAAAQLRGPEVAIPRSALPANAGGEYYFIESVVVSVDLAGGSLVVDWDADF